MIATSDGVLEQCRPPNISWDRYMEHCELAVNVPDLHSDEYSTDDEQLANKERCDNKRPKRITRTNSVIKIREKNGGPQGYVKFINYFKNITFICIIIYIFN